MVQLTRNSNLDDGATSESGAEGTKANGVSNNVAVAKRSLAKAKLPAEKMPGLKP
jgi:hypothetical protein